MSHYVLVMGAATRDGKAGGRRHVGTGVVLYITAYRTLQSMTSCLEGTQCQYILAYAGRGSFCPVFRSTVLYSRVQSSCYQSGCAFPIRMC